MLYDVTRYVEVTPTGSHRCTSHRRLGPLPVRDKAHVLRADSENGAGYITSFSYSWVGSVYPTLKAGGTKIDSNKKKFSTYPQI